MQWIRVKQDITTSFNLTSELKHYQDLKRCSILICRVSLLLDSIIAVFCGSNGHTEWLILASHSLFACGSLWEQSQVCVLKLLIEPHAVGEAERAYSNLL